MGSSKSRTDQLVAGLVSVTFRSLTPDAVAALAVRAQLHSIEWGGDVHVPHGDQHTAASVRNLCADHGLAISAYASYYRAGARDAATNPTFEQVLETAKVLMAPKIRVWAGNRASALASDRQRANVVDDLQTICRAAEKEGLAVGMEYHEGTLTDTPASALQLCRDVGAANLYCNWQPRIGVALDESLADIDVLRPRLGDVHVFQLAPDRSRRPLRDGIQAWQSYLTAIIQSDSRQRHVSLEFVKDDDPRRLLDDAQALREMIQRVNEAAHAA
jgi:sugar phosphate isomerase/epimerase